MLRKIINANQRHSTLLMLRRLTNLPSANRFLDEDDDETRFLSSKELELQNEIKDLDATTNKLYERILEKDEVIFRLKEQNSILTNQLTSARKVIHQLQKLDGRDPSEQLKAEIEVHLRETEFKTIKNKI